MLAWFSKIPTSTVVILSANYYNTINDTMIELIVGNNTNLSNGFAIFILGTSFIRFSEAKHNAVVNGLTATATLIIRVTAIVFLFFSLADLQQAAAYYIAVVGIKGAEWLTFLVYPIIYGLLPQGLWIRRLRRSKAFCIVLALLILFAPYFMWAVLLIQSLYDYSIPAIRTLLPGYTLLYNWAQGLLIFLVILGIVHFIKIQTGKLRKTR